MFLSGEAIHIECQNGTLVVSPFNPARLHGASYILSLGNRFRRWKPRKGPILLWSEGAAIDFLEEPYEEARVTILPGEFLLGCTQESVAVARNRAGMISPLSHVARFGLSINGGADWINPGYGERVPTRLTLELCNHSNTAVSLDCGMPIAHLRIAAVHNPSSSSARAPSIYEGGDPVDAPALFEEWGRPDRVPDYG